MEVVERRRELQGPAAMEAPSATQFLLPLSAAFFFSGVVFVSYHRHCDVYFRRLLQSIDGFDQFINRSSMFLFCNVIILLITMDSGLLGLFAPPPPPHPPPASASGLLRSKRDDDGVEKSGGEFNCAAQKVKDRLSSKWGDASPAVAAVAVDKSSSDEVEKSSVEFSCAAQKMQDRWSSTRDIESIVKTPDRRSSKRDDASPTVAAVVGAENSSEFSCAAQKVQLRRSTKRDDASAAFAVVVTKRSSQFIRTAEMQDRRSSKWGTVAPAPAIAAMVIEPCKIKDGLENSAGCLDLVAVRGVEKEKEEQIIHPLMEEEEEAMDDLHKRIEEFIENFKSQRRKEAMQLVTISSN